MPKLELRAKLGQQMSLTPQLLQAIKLLQMSQADLLAFIESEIEKNPLLEREDQETTDTAETGAVAEAADGDWLNPSEDAGDIAATLDTDVENIFPEDDGSAPPSSETWQESYSPYWQEQGGGSSDYDTASDDTLSISESLT
ncbi:MAG: RNA polymerase sigma-54 factor, partial [Pseudomonadota bacterium]